MELIGTLPQSAERDGKELDLRTPLGTAWLALKGWAAPEVWSAQSPPGARVGEGPQPSRGVSADLLWAVRQRTRVSGRPPPLCRGSPADPSLGKSRRGRVLLNHGARNIPLPQLNGEHQTVGPPPIMVTAYCSSICDILLVHWERLFIVERCATSHTESGSPASMPGEAHQY